MDPRDPRQPPPSFSSRNNTSPYGRTPFPPSSNSTPYPPSTHAPNAAPSYADHQRRPSDPSYYNQPRTFGQDGPPAPAGHSRHQSASSVGHGTPVNRAMPPPSSPQQGPPPPLSSYGPPPPRAPPVSVGPPSAFPSGRELPALGQRGGMSISDMLRDAPASREPPPPPQYGSPTSTSGPSNPGYGPSHASPRIQSTGPDYAPFRRPQTPEHQRSYGPRDHRANSAGSPPGRSHYSTPEGRHFGTPYRTQAAEERREPIRVPNPNAPPRPNSQPISFNPQSRVPDSRPSPADNPFGPRQAENGPRPGERPESSYGRPSFDDRERHERQERQERIYGYERERQERDAAIERDAIQRERERRERDLRERERAESARHEEYRYQMAQRNAQAYLQRDSLEAGWTAPPYDPAGRPSQQPQQNGYDQAPSYGPPTQASNEARHEVSSEPPRNAHLGLSLEAEVRERQRLNQQSQQPQAQQQTPSSYQQHPLQNVFGPSGHPQPPESPIRRVTEDHQQMQRSRSFLGIQEINKRSGRASPLPQAVQGAQVQMSGPGGEPGIKNEFGRMFSGIGSGVGTMGAPSPVTAGPQGTPLSSSGMLRREDVDGNQESPMDVGAQKLTRTASMGGRRKKLKDEDSRDDESSGGRRTPSSSGRGKRSKTHHHHHHHHHHHRPDAVENLSPSVAAFKNTKSVHSPPLASSEGSHLHHHHVPISRPHHHNPVPLQKPPPAEVEPNIPIPKVEIRSSAVVEAVKHLSRNHLGHTYYESRLSTSRSSSSRALLSRRGYQSSPTPIPQFAEGQANSTFTIIIPRIYFEHENLKEITSRRAAWGADIYTDDSDVIAACIHQGWFRGAWADGIDISMLGLELPGESSPREFRVNDRDPIFRQPPRAGPEDVPENHDVHVDILILPRLEEYASITRFGMKSREWGGDREGHKGVHDGMSFSIHCVRYMSGVDSKVHKRNFAKRKKFLQLDDQEVESDSKLSDMFSKGSGTKQNHQFQESFERGGPGLDMGAFKGVGTNSWWKESEASAKRGKNEQGIEIPRNGLEIGAQQYPPHSLGGPQTPPREIHGAPLQAPTPSPLSTIDPREEIERVTERMIKNVNMAEEQGSSRGYIEEIKDGSGSDRNQPSPTPASTESLREGIPAGKCSSGEVAVKLEAMGHASSDGTVET